MSMVPQRQLGLFDSICIVVGIIVGAGIYETSPTIASCMPGWTGVLGVWLLGGLLALTGALCYAELATTYPHEGGDYVYLRRAYGNWSGYLFGWSQLAIIRPGDIALMAFVFGRYAASVHAPFANSALFYAAAAVVVLTVINVVGVRESKWTQNTLTVVKALGLLAIAIAAVVAPPSPAASGPAGPTGLSVDGLKLSLILVLFTFGGWNEMAYVAAEVRHPKRNIVRAIVLSTLGVAVLYLLVNIAFLAALGQGRMAGSKAVAADAVAAALPDGAGRLVSVLICVSALGAANGLVFTGARISYAMGTGHSLFRALGRWHPRLGTPVWALLLQGALSLAIVMLARSFMDTILYTAPAVWLFFLATGASVFVLRLKEPQTPRPYRVTGGIVTNVVFCACCVFMFYSCVTYAWAAKPMGLAVSSGLLAAGAALYWSTGARRGRPSDGQAGR